MIALAIYSAIAYIAGFISLARMPHGGIRIHWLDVLAWLLSPALAPFVGLLAVWYWWDRKRSNY